MDTRNFFPRDKNIFRCFLKFFRVGLIYFQGFILLTPTNFYLTIPNKVLDEITYPFLNVNGATTEAGE